MSRQYTFEVRMDYLIRFMAAAAAEREWYELEATLLCAGRALERAVRESKKRKPKSKRGGSK